MPYLADIAQTTFLFADASESVGSTLDRIGAVESLTHLVVRRTDPDRGAAYFLWDVDESFQQLYAVDGRESLERFLGRDSETSVPVLDPETPISQAELPCLVADSGVVTGFVDQLRPEVVLRGPDRRTQDVQVSLETAFPDRLQVGEAARLRVSLWIEEDDLGLPTVPLGETVQARISADGALALARPEDEEQTLRVTDPPEPPVEIEVLGQHAGLGRLHLSLVYRGVGIGRSVIRAQVSETDRNDPDDDPSAKSRAFSLPREVPDLTLWILERFDGGRARLELELTAADPSFGLNRRTHFGPKEWSRTEVNRWVDDLFYDLQNARDERSPQIEGLRLFERMFPQELREEIWKLRKRIRYVLIQSEEALIPWELCRLSGRDADGRVEEGGFLCEEFAVTRWRPGLPQQPSLSLENLAVILPDTSLEAATLELPTLEALEHRGCRVTRVLPPRLARVEQALISGQFDGLHFSGHGDLSDTEPFLALDHGERLTPAHIAGRVTHLGQAKPVVMLNACYTGRSTVSWGAVDGWAIRFLDAGCSAFVGTYWRVGDRVAAAFASSFYGALMAGSAVADAVHSGRLAAREQGGDDWLAYTAYAYPLAKRSKVSDLEEVKP